MTKDKKQTAEGQNQPKVQAMTNNDGTRFYQDIPDYQNADEQTRAEMDALIATINPFDVNTIMAFGKEANDEVLAVSRRINERVAADESFMSDMRAFGEAVSNLDLSALSDKVQDFVQKGFKVAKNNLPEAAAAGVGFLTLGPIAAGLAFLGVKGARLGNDQVQKAKKKLSGDVDYEAKAESIRDDLRKSVLSIKSIVGQLEAANEKIPGFIEEINAMGQARTSAFSKLSLAVGAGREITRRFETDILPAFQEGEVNMAEVEQIQTAYGAITRRVEGLIGARAVSLQNVTMLESSKRMYINMQMKINEHLTTSVPEWEGQIAQGNLIVDQFDLQQSITAADKKGIELLRNQQGLHEASKAMYDRSQEQGTYHLGEIAKATEKMALRLSLDMKTVGDYRRKNVEAQQRVLTATENLAARFQETAEQRVRNLLAAPSQDSARTLAAPRTVEVSPQDKIKGLLHQSKSNDNQDDVAAPAREKKTRTAKGPGGMD
ncbi:MAG: toxic anion resistance protein [Micavibrio sp.]